jgi:peptidyl-prolyl cis-trans isomerase D
MFGSFRKHQKWIWMLGVIIIVPSFVIFFTPNVHLSPKGATDYDFGSINGNPITREEFLQAFNESRLNYFLRSRGRNWPGNDDTVKRNLERDAVSRIFLAQKMKELGVEASNEAVAQMASQQLKDYPLKQFEADILRPHDLTAEDYERYLRHEVGIQQLAAAAAMSGRLVNPSEAETLFRKEHINYHTEAAVFWASNYLNKVVVTPQAIGRFYTNRMALYRIPDRVRVSYVEFDASNYLEQADQRLSSITNLTEIIDEAYRQKGPESYKDTNGVVMTEAAAKVKIKENERQHLALLEAQRKAAAFGNQILERPQPNKPEDLDNVASADGYQVQVTEPFDAREGPAHGDFPSEFRQKGTHLNLQKPIEVQPIVGEKAVYVIALKEQIKSEMPPLERVKEKVTEDYKAEEARSLARNIAMSFHTRLTNGLATNKTFEAVCQEAKVDRVVLPLFSPSTRPPLEGLDPRFNLSTIQRYVEDLKPGRVTNYLPSRDGGYILYLREKTPVEESTLKEELPDFIAQLRQYREGQAFDMWFRKQAEQARVVVPKREDETKTGKTSPTRGKGT